MSGWVGDRRIETMRSLIFLKSFHVEPDLLKTS